MSSLSESISSPHELIEDLQSQVATLARELKRISIERDYFKEQLAARMRQLFAAKSEARGLAQSDLFFNLSGTDSPPLAA